MFILLQSLFAPTTLSTVTRHPRGELELMLYLRFLCPLLLLWHVSIFPILAEIICTISIPSLNLMWKASHNRWYFSGCAKCTLVNNDIHNQCKACGEAKVAAMTLHRENILSQFIPRENEWACRHCTFANPNVLKSCSICGEWRREGPEKQSEHWLCPQCTLENSLQLTHCSVCGLKKTEVEKGAVEVIQAGRMKRQKSVMSDLRRKEDEENAREQFQRISLFCKHVSTT